MQAYFSSVAIRSLSVGVVAVDVAKEVSSVVGADAVGLVLSGRLSRGTDAVGLLKTGAVGMGIVGMGGDASRAHKKARYKIIHNKVKNFFINGV